MRPRLPLAALAATLCVVLGASCDALFYERNPAFCCLDEAHCAAGGAPAGQTFPCTNPGDVCDVDRNACIPDPTVVECETSNDCAATDPLRPACIDGRCVACGDEAHSCPATAPVCSASYVCEDCTDQASCSRFADTPFCSATSGACVACRPGNNADCTTATAPICDQAESCRACRAGECPSGVCNAGTGACVADADIIAVSMTGSDAGTCTRAAPCRSIQRGISAAGGRQWMTVAAGDYDTFTIGGGTLTILAAPGAHVTRGTVGPVVDITGPSVVTIERLRIHDGPGSSGDGVRCSEAGPNRPTVTLRNVTVDQNGGIGIKGTGCTLSIERSSINANSGGGISIAGSGATFDVTNNFIFRNGNSTSAAFGGVHINLTSPGTSRLEFNTIVDNQAAAGPLNAGGVLCGATSFAAPNNIIARNRVDASTTETNSQTLGACTYPTSAIASNVTGLAFVSPDSIAYDYHIGPSSSAINQATTSTLVMIDFDGDSRQQGQAHDQGADERP